MEMILGSIDSSKSSSKVEEDLIPLSDNVTNSVQSQTLFPSDSSISSHSFTNSNNVNRLTADVNQLHLSTLSLTLMQKDVIIQEYAKFICGIIQNEKYFKEKGIEFESLSDENKLNYINEAISCLYDNYISNIYKLFHDTIMSYVRSQLIDKTVINDFSIDYLMMIVTQNKEMSIKNYLINGVKYNQSNQEINNDFLEDPDFIFDNDVLYQAIKPKIVELFHFFCPSKEEIINKVMEAIQTNINN